MNSRHGHQTSKSGMRNQLLQAAINAKKKKFLVESPEVLQEKWWMQSAIFRITSMTESNAVWTFFFVG